MRPDLTHTLDTLEAALRPGEGKGHDVRDEDAYEAITTLEALGNYEASYAGTLWRHMADLCGPQPRHQARRVLEHLRERAGLVV